MENKQLKSFKDLKVWQKAADLASLVYTVTEKFPRLELYGLTIQMRRSTISISSNIAEGFKRNHKKEKLQFYNIAYSSVAELESQTEISYKLGYLPEKDYQKLLFLTTEVAKMSDCLIKSVRKLQDFKSLYPMSYILFPIIVFLYSIFCILNPTPASAAVLYLDPAEGNYYQGDTFIVEVRLETEECVNTVKAELTFSTDILVARDVSAGNSILSLWLEEPQFSNKQGFISFLGGIPGGYCGRLPGDPGLSNIIGKIVFRVLPTPLIEKPVRAKVDFSDSSQVLLHDGLGTSDKLSFRGAVFTVLSGIPEKPKDDWQEQLKQDRIAPEPFEIEVHQEPTIFEGKYFISFSTTDKQTGVNYYQVKEGKKDWGKVISPYLLKDQSLKGIIKVKAVDKAGNERIAEYVPVRRPFPWWIVILVLAGVIVFWWIIKKLKIKSSK